MNPNNIVSLKKHCEEENKISTAKRKMSVMCKCGHRVYIHAFNKRGYAICSWCGHKVNGPKLDFKEKLMNKLKEN